MEKTQIQNAKDTIDGIGENVKTNLDKLVDYGTKHPIITTAILWLLIGKVGKSFNKTKPNFN